MWATEHSIETTASREAIWHCLSEVAPWPDWNGDIARIEISGPCAVGSTISMMPIGEDTVELRIVEVSEPDLFVDEADRLNAVVRTVHRIDPLIDRRRRVSYRMEITGPADEEIGPYLGPQIGFDFPQTLSALVDRAEP